MKAQPRPYRAMKIGTEEWVEGWCVPEGSEIYIVSIGLTFVKNKHQVDPSTLSQYTGEQDQLSQPLWEDDVCKDLRGDRWLIIWKKGAFLLENMATKQRWLLDGSKVEKVGTMYDSPAKLYGDKLNRSEVKHQGDDDEE